MLGPVNGFLILSTLHLRCHDVKVMDIHPGACSKFSVHAAAVGEMARNACHAETDQASVMPGKSTTHTQPINSM
jgi:hypothetical protein